MTSSKEMTISNDNRNRDANYVAETPRAHPLATSIRASLGGLSMERAKHSARDGWKRISPSSRLCA
jgi:hypothetical protein